MTWFLGYFLTVNPKVRDSASEKKTLGMNKDSAAGSGLSGPELGHVLSRTRSGKERTCYCSVLP